MDEAVRIAVRDRNADSFAGFRRRSPGTGQKDSAGYGGSERGETGARCLGGCALRAAPDLPDRRRLRRQLWPHRLIKCRPIPSAPGLCPRTSASGSSSNTCRRCASSRAKSTSGCPIPSVSTICFRRASSASSRPSTISIRAQNVKLKTYAEFRIRGSILDSLRDTDWAPRLKRRAGARVRSGDRASGTAAGAGRRKKPKSPAN